MQINIINPKAIKLLHDLAELKLISIQDDTVSKIEAIAGKARIKAAKDGLTLEEITKEVELVRSRRSAKSRR